MTAPTLHCSSDDWDEPWIEFGSDDCRWIMVWCLLLHSLHVYVDLHSFAGWVPKQLKHNGLSVTNLFRWTGVNSRNFGHATMKCWSPQYVHGCCAILGEWVTFCCTRPWVWPCDVDALAWVDPVADPLLCKPLVDACGWLSCATAPTCAEAVLVPFDGCPLAPWDAMTWLQELHKLIERWQNSWSTQWRLPWLNCSFIHTAPQLMHQQAVSKFLLCYML